jgi:uncharacterized membrane protein (DUF4010 family)
VLDRAPFGAMDMWTRCASAIEVTLQSTTTALNLVAALAAGLIIGLERGWRGRDVADGGRVAGLRTFALLGLLGGVLALPGAWTLTAGLVALAALASVSYREAVRATGNLSATSAVAQLLTFGLGAVAACGAPALAVSAAVLAAVLLNLRSTLHGWLRLIEHRDLSAGLQMLVLSAVVLPLLPNASVGPYGALNPNRLWWAVVLIAGLSLSGHVAIRFFGAERGALWSGLLGGLASSTGATLALARRLRDRPALLDASAAGALAACAVMFIRMIVVLLALAPALLRLLLLPLMTSIVVLLATALLHWLRRLPGGDRQPATELAPFDLGTALGFGAFLGVTAILSEASKQWLGVNGVYALSLLSGLADVDAITISMARMGDAGSVPAGTVAVAVGLAVLSNMASKAVMARVVGGRALGRRVGVGYAIAAAAGAGTLALTLAVA